MDNAKQQLVEKLKSSNNVLVTVSRNPTVDQLSALIGLSLIMNKLGKHCAGVFSGRIPSTLEFLKPEETIEKNTDSLRDFIIALDKNKADKLRYKVEDNIVRIFITPYKTSITQEDLEFSQGDFNVDALVALGVVDQSELDEAITAHGRILHDATVTSININSNGNLGSINWQQVSSSLSELVTELGQSLGDNIFDEQIATALLTGIVSETDRFSNNKTTPQTMNISSVLMSAGANQQLIASKLQEAPIEVNESSENEKTKEAKKQDGTLQIKHGEDATKKEKEVTSEELPSPEESANEDMPAGMKQGPKFITEPPTLGGTLTANTMQNMLDPSTDPMSIPKEEDPQLLEHTSTTAVTEDKSNPPDIEEPATSQPPPGPFHAPEPPKAPEPAQLDIPPATPEVVKLPPPEPPEPITPAPQPEPPTVDLKPEPGEKSSSDETTDDVPELNIDSDGTITQLEQSLGSAHPGESETSLASDARDKINALDSESSNSSDDAIPLGPELHPDGDQSSEEPIASKDDGLPKAPPAPPPLPFQWKPPSED